MKEIVWDLIRDIKYYFEYDKNFYPRGLGIIIPWGYFRDILKSWDLYPQRLGIFEILGIFTLGIGDF